MFRHSFAYISDSSLLAIGGRYDTKDLLSIIHLNNDMTLTPLDFWPSDEFDGNFRTKQALYMDNAKIFKNDALDKYLYVSMMGKYMEVFDIIDNQIANRQSICDIYPKYETHNDGVDYKTEDEINRGFYVYTTDSLIYARPIEFSLESLRSGENYKGYSLFFSENIHVFDWSGNFMRKYELDTPIYSFIVDDKNDVLYTTTVDLETDESIVKKYILK